MSRRELLAAITASLSGPGPKKNRNDEVPVVIGAQEDHVLDSVVPDEFEDLAPLGGVPLPPSQGGDEGLGDGRGADDKLGRGIEQRGLEQRLWTDPSSVRVGLIHPRRAEAGAIGREEHDGRARKMLDEG